MRFIALLFVLFITFTISFDLMLKDPPIWPDEVFFADVANNIVLSGKFSTDLWKGTAYKIDECACWYPPVFFYSLAGLVKVFGVAILPQRLFSYLLGILTTLVLVSFGFRFINGELKKDKMRFVNQFLIICALPLLILSDFTISRGFRASMPEILLLFLGTLSLYLFSLTFNNKNNYKILVLSGVLSSLAFLSHIVGGAFIVIIFTYLLISEKSSLFKKPQNYILAVSFIIPIVIWILTILSKLEIMFTQMKTALFIKGKAETWLLTVFQTQPPVLQIIYIFYILLTLFAIIYFFIIRKHLSIPRRKLFLLLEISLIITWFFAILGRQFWYYLLPLPFLYFVSILILSDILQRTKSPHYKKMAFFTVFILFGVFLANMNIQLTNISAQAGEKYSYEKFNQQILEVIPDNRGVFISSIPDPYYGFLKRHNKLYEFPTQQIELKKYYEILNKVDYIVFNGVYDQTTYKNFLPAYIEQNKEKLTKIGFPNQYQGWVVELKPRDQRVVP